MKAHIGVDSRPKVIHSVVATAANVHDSQDFTHEKGSRNRPLSEMQKESNRVKSTVRAKGEHPFQVIKRVFGFTKVRYRGLMKNPHRLQVTCALANLFMVRRRLLRQLPA
jgi:IS5 family transposase